MNSRRGHALRHALRSQLISSLNDPLKLLCDVSVSSSKRFSCLKLTANMNLDTAGKKAHNLLFHHVKRLQTGFTVHTVMMFETMTVQKL